MNAMLNIQVRVLGQQAAAQIKAMQGQLNALQKQTMASNTAAAGFNRTLGGGMSGLQRFGKNLQWTGRQIEYNFTLPLVIAGGMATKWALENEKAMVKVRKVYGDLGEDVGAELKALEKSFLLLSNRFGVHLDEVTEIAAAWAQAGAAGVALANATKATLQAMILGDMEAMEAMEGLLAVQAAYRLDSKQLLDVLADLNVVENQTAAGMQDLITVIVRAGGAARTAGIDHQYLSAMTASLIKTTGSAARVGSSLRTIFSRMLAPTRAAAELLKEVGVQVDSAAWASKNGTQRLQEMSTAFMNLTQSQQAIVSSTVASRWQINRFDTLMRDLALSMDESTRHQSAFGRAMDAQADKTQVAGVMARELSTVLASSPRAFQILTTNIKNAMAQGILPLLPTLISILNAVRGMITSFNNLSPRVQHLALAFLFLLAAVGPIARLIGSFTLLGTTIASAFGFAAKSVWFFGGSVMKVFGMILAPIGMVMSGALSVVSFSFAMMVRASGAAFVAMADLMWGFLRVFTGAMLAGIRGVAVAIGPILWGAMSATLAAVGQAAVGLSHIVIGSMTALVGIVGRAVTLTNAILAASATFFQAVWGIAATGVLTIWAGLSRAAFVAARAVQTTWFVATAAFQTMWYAATGAVVAAWRALPAFTTIMWTTIRAVWAAGFAALRVMTIGFVAFTKGAMIALQAAFASPWIALAIAAGTILVALVTTFRDEIVGGIIDAFNSLPEGIHSTLMTVVRMVKNFAMQVYEWLSYLNPFARHSPSLVDNVTAGVSTILDQYSRLNGVKAVIKEAISAHQAFLAATGAASRNMRMEEYSQKKADIVAVSPSAGPAVSGLISQIWQLKGALAAVGEELLNQGMLVQRLEREVAALMQPWEDSIAANELAQKKLRLEILQVPPAIATVNAQIKAQQGVVDQLQAKVTKLMQPWTEALKTNELAQKRLRLDMLKNPAAIDASTDAIREQREALNKLKDSILQTMRPYEDQIFRNTIEQKKLRLEILKLEEAGGAVDNLRDKFAALSGEIEGLRGQRTELQLAGAGSDVLAAYDSQIAGLEAQREALEGAGGGGAASDLQAQLEKLRRKGEIIQLETDIRFDPQLRDVDQKLGTLPSEAEIAANDPRLAQLEELRRAEEILGLERDLAMQPVLDKLEQEKQKLADLTSLAERLNAPYQERLANLQRELEILELQRDITMAPRLAELDLEKQKLDALAGAYSDISSQIDAMEGAFDKMASTASSSLAEAARKAREAAGGSDSATVAVEDFRNAGLGDFEVPGGEAPPGLGREGGLAEIEEFNKAMEEELANALKEMGSFDMFGPFKEMWNQGWEWLKKNVAPKLQPIIDGVRGFIDNLKEGADGPFASAIGSMNGYFEKALSVWTAVWDFLVAVLGPVFRWIAEKVVEAAGILGREIQNWAPMLAPLIEAIGHVFNVMVVIIKVALGIIMGVWTAVWPVLMHVLTPIIDGIVGIIRAGLEIARGVIMFILNLINGDFDKLWGNILTIVDGIWDAIYAVFSTAIGIVIGIVRGLVEGIINFFKWLWNVLVGHSIIPDMINAIIKWFQFLLDGIKFIWNMIWTVVKWAWENIALPIFNAIKWVIDNIVVPAFKFLLETVKVIWNAIAAAISWVWNNIIKPLWGAIKWTIDNVLIPAFNFLKDTIRKIWDAIAGAIAWVWNNVIKPLWDGIGWFIDNVLVVAFERLKTGIKRIWEAVGGAIAWVWDNIIKPIWEGIGKFIDDTLMAAFERLKTGMERIWNGIKDTASTVWGGINDVLKGAVNIAIGAINAIIKGINKVADVLPGISFNIALIPQLASGGALGNVPSEAFAAGGRIKPTATEVTGGFRTNRVRAIVGEGNPIYPEYVIPTDPTFRNRAMGLANSLANEFGMEMVPPQYAIGGILDFAGDAWDATGGKVASGVKKGAAMAAFAPLNAIADAAIGRIPWDKLQQMTRSLKDVVYNWVKGTDEKVPDVPDLGGAPGYQAMFAALKQQFPGARLHSGLRPGAITATGNPSYHGMGRAIDTNPRMDMFEWLLANYGSASKEIIFSPAGGRQVRNGRSHMYTGITRAMHFDHIHWAMAQGGLIPSLGNGGIVMPRPGGMLARLGERGQREAVVPLPRDFSGGGNEYHFHGDLSFPNIQSGDDAEEFIRNLEGLV